MRLVVDDLDPYRMPETGNIGGRLTDSETRRWQSTLCEAWELLVRAPPARGRGGHHGDQGADAAGAPARGQSSSTSRETFGCVALSTPPDASTLAITLTHETQHAKLSALLDIVPLTLPDDGSRHYAPWREDPRPVSGLLQGAYAFLGVTGFWRRHRDLVSGEAPLRAGAEFFRWREATRLVTGTLLGSGRLTSEGEAFTAGMARRLDDWVAGERAGPRRGPGPERADEHRARWHERNG